MGRIVVVHGPNLNLLGVREPEIYGHESLEDINRRLEQLVQPLGIDIEFFQSNHEGELVDYLQSVRARADFVIINAGALTHYSIALHDALRALGKPVIEVHLSNPYAREEFRHHSYVAPVAMGGVFGLGSLSYRLAVLAAVARLAPDKVEPWA
ncbi:MAG: type II 3-dehydroquinate dehydratase [Syntrophomonadaceae bacterium]|jgi:3-dehydroquinate dehydratase-2|nr:type II 3-dehydroquinate dehydratase [Syntrophomonadaceae bacterium]MDH7498642.1 type II 3-dehydroquinate dehydratase [Syntrophomonadaceae bacterium]